MTELMYTGDIGKVASVIGGEWCTDELYPQLESNEEFHKVLGISKATKDINEILAPLENSEESSFILIEGVPGIGKSVLLKEIAYRWSKKEILQKFELVLLIYLRDPSLQQTKSVGDFLQLFYRGHKNMTKVVSACSEYLSSNGGKSVVLLLDGYDEYPRHLQENSLITDILQRRVLPLCGLIVSSRPHASEHFHQQATLRIDILGFTETEREHYINKALPGQPLRIKEVTKYLQQQPSVDSICLIPFNMVILLYLYKLGIPLPKNSTDLYHHFICSSICRHIYTFGNPLTHSINDLTTLPEPYNKIIKQLSKLSLEALNDNKLIFTLDEITAACPEIVTIPGVINGFGLLQAVQHFGLYRNTITLNFIHFTIQEFLAAHYISHLPSNEELKVLEANFGVTSTLVFFPCMYHLPRGNDLLLKNFSFPGTKTNTISPKFLKDQLKCLQLYHCFSEAGDYKICKSIEQGEIFHRKISDLVGTQLAFSDMECISLFLTSSLNQQWVKLNLWNCCIQDHLLKLLCHGLCHSSDVTVNKLILINNSLTVQSSSLISKITLKCKVKELWIDFNDIVGDDQQLYYMLTNPSSELQELHMYCMKLSSRGAINLFKALNENNKLKVLDIGNNAISDEACDAVTTALERNNCLIRLIMYRNPLSSKAIVNIVQRLETINTLELLWLPKCLQENLRPLQVVNFKRRQSQGYYVKLEIKFSPVY